MMRRTSLAVGVALALLASLPGARAHAASPAFHAGWPPVQEQLAASRVIPGAALERLIVANQDFSLLRPEELNDRLRLPPWLRGLYRRNHPKEAYSAKD